MGLDFDVREYVKKLKDEQPHPPFACPIEKCDKNYKSLIGLQYHLVNYDHDNPSPLAAVVTTPNRKKGRSRVPTTPNGKDVSVTPKEGVTFLDIDDMVQYDIDGKSIKIPASETLPIITEEEYQKLFDRGSICSIPEVKAEPHLQLPEASFKNIENYNLCDAPTRPNAYIRFIEKSAEEMDGEVEYDVDEEDTTWLTMINEKRRESNLNEVSIDKLELLMDRLEKESYFQATVNGSAQPEVDDDAVCCICMDGECQNTNVILFCDMCNLAVHQDCYGVPYIPEGQWLCRRCLQSPSTPISCVLCPNTGGAFKQTDTGHWAHVVCALWIPEVRFANTVFLEPIDSIETIPAARWRLTCYVCKDKGHGACIQCHRNSCYAAFHVTCAQQAGLYMTMDTVKDNATGDASMQVQKFAYCHSHTPHDAKMNDEDIENTRHKLREARKVLNKKRTSAPVILIPTIPPNRVQEISSLINLQKKSEFINKLIAYWTLKRQYRNGVPLLRRLQSQGHNHGGISRNNPDGKANTSELYQQLKYWQMLRQDLERARLLCELVRKREKLKVANIKVYQDIVKLQLNPLQVILTRLLESLISKDNSDIFMHPVDTSEVPDYLDIVSCPMDFSTMRVKLDNDEYTDLDIFEGDFDLMIKNCLAYNNKGTVFYRAGIRMRDIAGPMFRSVREQLHREGILEKAKIEKAKNDDSLVVEVDDELKTLLKAQPCEDIVQKLLILADKSQVIKNPNHRTKKIKQIRVEITKMRKSMSSKPKKVPSSQPAEKERFSDSESEDTEMNEIAKGPMSLQTPPCSPLKSANSSASPAGVNRRTAVLFTRKAQAVIKRPELSVKEESSCEAISPPEKSARSPKRPSGSKSKKTSEMRSTSASPKKKESHTFDTIPDSFRVYRGNGNTNLSETEDSDMNEEASCSSCTQRSDSEFYSSDENSEDSRGNVNESDFDMRQNDFDKDSVANDTNDASQSNQKDGNKNSTTPVIEKPSLEPLQLVWAKCRGYPWYPALILDPKTPKGFVYNGVPLPAPPTEVLALRKNYTDEVFLVLFFDLKRTWQWLPSNKLEILGIDKELDQGKLIESRKPTERKAVKKAYQDALLYQSKVSDLEGQGPDPIM